ncbi:MAG: hypothetical protein EOP47_18090 [Sphingobacteriaceae bacterium]|nr:MAG: hypothetical protein EOP47_18090 [Sphingobacteriaceae bacterium]
MKINYYNAIFVALDVVAFILINFSIIRDDMAIAVTTRLLFLTFIIFSVSNVILIYQELFKNKVYILLYTYILSYIAKVIIFTFFCNEGKNIIANAIYLHSEKGAYIRIMLPFVISFILTMLIFMVLDIKRVMASQSKLY